MTKAGATDNDPMEARSVDVIPAGDTWQYEPKWDGFRCLLARDGNSIAMLSKSGQPLDRYFPEIVAAAKSLPEKVYRLDGELVVSTGQDFSFDHLLQRIHPAASRIMRLSKETPATFIAFDLLARGKNVLSHLPLAERRRALEDFAEIFFADSHAFRLSAATNNIRDAKRWLQAAGGGTDGVIAKRTDLPYQFGNRDGMQKIKRHRSADCVIGGFRYGTKKTAGRNLVGSLLLGLYDASGKLNHVGFSSGIKAADKPALTDRLEAIVSDRSFTGVTPGGPSRWSTKRSTEWCPVTPKLVVEVSYDHFTGDRFRHGTTILRWRTDKTPKQYGIEQLAQKSVLPASILDAEKR